jgi:hypothetical protein
VPALAAGQEEALSMHRLTLAAALAAWALAAAPARAQGIPAVVYPLHGEGVGREELADVQSLIQSALRRTGSRGGLGPASPATAKNACGPATTATKECLAPLAGSGVLLLGVVARQGGRLAISLRAMDSSARSYGPVRALVDPVIQNAEVLAQALENLEEIRESAVAAAARKAQAAAAPPADLSAPAPSPRSAGAAPQRPAGAWRRSAGKWTTLAGVVMLGGGTAVAVMNRNLAEDLEAKYRSNSLTAADAEDYERIDTYNTLSTGLFIAGGVATATGLYLWGTAPDVRPTRGGFTLGVSGRF